MNIPGCSIVKPLEAVTGVSHIFHIAVMGGGCDNACLSVCSGVDQRH